MNGRVYDPTLGRFIQADPHIQAPSDSQSLNRYSYVKNNPLSYTDPTGYFFKKLKKFIKKWGKVIVAAIAAYYTFGLVQAWALNGIAASSAVGGAFTMKLVTAKALAGFVAGAASGFVAGGILSGTLKGAMKGAAAGAITGFASAYANFGSVSGLIDAGRRTLISSAGGCLAAEVSGGNCGKGAKLAGLSQALKISLDGLAGDKSSWNTSLIFGVHGIG